LTIKYPNGNIGIGTNSPLSKLHINTGTNQNFRVRPGTDVGATNGIALNSRTDDDGSLQQLTLRASDVIMLPSGNVGIGIANPSEKLEVQDGYLSTYHNANVNDAGYGVQFYTNGGGSKNSLAAITLSQVGTARSGNLLFQTSNAGAPSTKMIITSGGSVGINNTSPMNSAWGTETSTKQLSIDASGYAVLNLQGSTGRKYSMGVGDGNFYMCYDNTAGRHNIVVSSSGNIMIGTTTDTGAKLNVGGSYDGYPVSIEASSGGNQLSLTRGGAVAQFYMGGSSGGATQLYVRSGGSGGVRLDAGSTGWVSASDIRLKNINRKIENAIENLSQLQTIYFS